MARPVAAVTGASSGIGTVFARKLAAAGYDLLLIARRQDRLEALAAELAGASGTAAECFPADLTEAGALERAAARLAAEPRLDLLVNNAGFGTRGRFFEAPFDEQERMNRLHVTATMRLSHAALAGMTGRNHGAVINVSSVAGFTRSPGNTSYCATKAWINAFTEGLYLDLKSAGSQVVVQALCPGFTYTEFHDVIGVDRAAIAKSLWMNAEDVVDASLAGLAKGKLFVVPGWRYRLFVAVINRVPVGWRLRMEAYSPHTRYRLKRAAE